jgi:hypothetical protein
VEQIEALGVPGLIGCNSLTIKGQVHFEPGVTLGGDVVIENSAASVLKVKAGTYQDQSIRI